MCGRRVGVVVVVVFTVVVLVFVVLVDGVIGFFLF